jgi:DnaJ-like protein
MTERKPRGMSFETWVDSQISRAQAQGAFKGLPGYGRPLPRRDREKTAFDWALEWARRENGDDEELVAGMLPPGLALRRERDLLRDAVTQLPTEAAARAMAEDYNERVRAFWRRPQFTPDVVPGLADVEALTAHWRETRPAPQPAPDPDPTPVRPARRWFRRRI